MSKRLQLTLGFAEFLIGGEFRLALGAAVAAEVYDAAAPRSPSTRPTSRRRWQSVGSSSPQRIATRDRAPKASSRSIPCRKPGDWAKLAVKHVAFLVVEALVFDASA